MGKGSQSIPDTPAGESPDAPAVEDSGVTDQPEFSAPPSAGDSTESPATSDGVPSEPPSESAPLPAHSSVGAASPEIPPPAEGDSGDTPDVDHLDPVGVVRPGDQDGLAALVVRSLGYGDSIIYDGPVVERVKALQAENDLEADGVVRGLTWCYVLPVGHPPSGVSEQVFHRLGGDDTLLEGVGGKMTRDVWKQLWLTGFTERL